MSDTTLTELPPLVDAPFVVGSGGQRKHAISHDRAVAALERDTRWPFTPAVCGDLAMPVRRWGAFAYDNPRLAGFGCERCPDCGWLVALEQHTEAAELAFLTPTGTDLEVLSRFLSEPLLVVRLCEATLAQPGEYDPDHPHLAQLLGHVTAHGPQILVPEDCAEGGCDHDQPGDTGRCRYPDAALGCAACSVRAGGWAGEWEGQYAPECTVTAPCGVLRTLARHYGIAIEPTSLAADRVDATSPKE